MPLPPEVLLLATWDQLDHASAFRFAQTVEKALPPPWRLARVEECQGHDRHRSVAFFGRKDSEFALIPRGEVLLGYDPAFPLELSEQDLEDWERARYEYGDLNEHLQVTMTPLRKVVLKPFLMEITAREMHTEPNWKSGQTVGTRTADITIRQVRDWANKDGFRMPTSNQWEHACRAGTRTFWWWGNRLELPIPDRNPFGLQIALDTYLSEWCTDPDVFRGGDGGCAAHGGLDGLPTALRLASAYFEPFAEASNDSDQFWGACRRVFPLEE